MREALKDRAWRRRFRAAILVFSCLAASALVISIYQIVAPVGKATAASIAAATKLVTGQLEAPTPSEAASSSIAPAASSAVQEPDAKHKPTKSTKHQTLGHATFSGLRDLLMPVVWIVSILTAASVAILISMLKFSFAQDQPSKAGTGEKDGFFIPLSTIEAFKALVDSFKSLFSKR